MATAPRVLLIYPRFVAPSFWNYRAACEVIGKRYPAAPLGLITVAAMLPQSWDFKLVDRNTEELDPADLDRADLVMVSAMLPQQRDALDVVDLCRRHGVPVVVGGPDPTSSPHVYGHADFQILGEAESVIDAFVEAWMAGDRRGVFEAPKFQADVTRTPIPRFDLLRFKSYLYIGVQFSRGCPFNCEFCDIIELYGRVPRTKAPEQILAELDTLYNLGYRGHVDFVDDNLIGNKKALKKFLPELKAWQEARGHPFEFSTEASINLADDDQLLRMLREANFFAVFIGIESPDPDTLIAMQKKQNIRRDLVANVHKIYASGIFVVCGFILGFDTEKGSIAKPMIEVIEAMSIPVCMVGLLYALPNTQLTRRLQREGRLYLGHDQQRTAQEGDQCTSGLNFDTRRNRRDILADYAAVLERVYSPEAYFGRVRRLGRELARVWPGPPASKLQTVRDLMDLGRVVANVALRHPSLLPLFLSTLADCARHNPPALPAVVALMVLYLHFGPFSRQVIAQVREQIAAIDNGAWETPPLAPVAVQDDRPVAPVAHGSAA